MLQNFFRCFYHASLLVSFTSSSFTPRFIHHSVFISSRITLFSIFDEDKDDDVTTSGLPKDFNPFDFKSRGNSVIGYSGTQISLRKTTMQALVSDLLNVVGREEMTQEILDEYKSFLLEPLDDDEAVLDPDSIYDSTMDRVARYQTYRKSMDDRISSAKVQDVKQVLISMRDFVLDQE